jgi:predicted hydrocarbon binding protein
MSNNSLLDSFVFSDDIGSIHFNDVRYMIIRPETICALQRLVEERLGDAGADIFFESGLTGGSLSTEKYMQLFGHSAEEAARYMCDMGGQIGWGKFILEEFNLSSKKIAIRVLNSPFAVYYGESEKAVCHFIRGIVAGVALVVFGHLTEVEETLCLAKQDTFCRFETISKPEGLLQERPLD